MSKSMKTALTAIYQRLFKAFGPQKMVAGQNKI